MRMSWSDGIDPTSECFAIAASTNPRLRVVAGPGTGKSFAMKRRVARLLEAGIQPNTILPVTFTRVAAEDLHRELVAMDTPGAGQLVGVTLHSLALRLLSRNHVLEATNRIPRPLNEFELEPLIADLAAFGGIRKIEPKIDAYHAAWARLPDDDPAKIESERDIAFETALISWLTFHRGMLIGEVIPYFYQYLRSNPAAEERSEYKHILVDEFQDLNRVEQEIIRMLSDDAEVCIVGDDDQSVYSFKFSHPKGIQDWCQENEGADDLALTECRRCPGQVVRIANHLIAQSVTRTHERTLIESPENGEGDVKIVQYSDLTKEVAGITTIVEDLMGSGTHPGDIIVLCQRKRIGTSIYEALKAKGLPVKSYYAEAELADEETQARFAQLKLAANPDDRVALRWLIGRGSTAWFNGGYKRVRARCEQTGLNPWQVLNSIAEGDEAIAHTAPIVANFKIVKAQTAAIAQTLADSGLPGLIDQLFPDGDDRWRDLRALCVKISSEDFNEIGEVDLTEFVSSVSYAIAQPEIPSEIQDVRVMSLHKSKGLSAPATIVASCVEGVIPRRPDDKLTDVEKLAHIEEQRRLFFVGITRVKAKPTEGQPGRLILTYSRRMSAFEARKSGIVPAKFEYGEAVLNGSRFLAELGPHAPEPVKG